MHDGPNMPGRQWVFGRLRDLYDGRAAEPREAPKLREAPKPREAAQPRRALIPEFEAYEPPSRWKKLRSAESEHVQFEAYKPPSRWKKLRSAESEHVQFEAYKPPSRWKRLRSVESVDVQVVAFIMMLGLAVLLGHTVLIAAIANNTGLDIPWLSTIVISLAIAAFACLCVSLPNDGGWDGDGGGG
jgi:hypothetical protein